MFARTRTRRHQMVGAVAVLLVMLPGAGAAATPALNPDPDPLLLSPVTATRPVDVTGLPEGVDRARDASAALSALPVPGARDEVTLNLFPDATVTADIERSTVTRDGWRTWTGDVPELEGGTVTLVAQGGVLAGSIVSAEGSYRLRSVGTQVLIEEVTALPSDGDGHIAVRGGSAAASAGASAAAEGTPVLDILVAYTTAARTAVGGVSAMESQARLYVASTNQSFVDSGVNAQLRLVGTAEVPNAVGSNSTALGQLRNPGDGVMDVLPGLRESTGADLVTLQVHDPNGSNCGIAYVNLSQSTAFASSAYSISRWDCGAQTFAHELGHNLGLGHDSFTNDRGVLPYAWGHVNAAARWRTLMAYGSQCAAAGTTCATIMRWSNPDQLWNGSALGVAPGQPGESDSRAALNIMTPHVAAFRATSTATAPTNLRAAAGAGRVSLAWDPFLGATSYRVYRNGVLASSPRTTALALSGLAPGVEYRFEVSALTAGGETARAGLTVTPVPGVPAGLRGTPGNSQALLTWGAVSGATGYKVFRDGVLATTLPATARGATITGLTNHTAYRFTVAAVAHATESAPSTAATVTPVPPPPAPSNLRATPGHLRVALAWDAAPGALSYRVFRNGALAASVTGTSATVSATNGVPATLVVRAVGAGVQESPNSAAVTATAVPAPPAGVRGTPGNAQAALTWGAVSGATGYKVFRDGALATTLPATARGATITGLTNHTAYRFTVAAVAHATESAPSAAATVTPVPPPPAPSNVRATAANASVSLVWDPAPRALSYRVYRNNVAIGSTTRTAAVATRLVNGTSYTFQISAVGVGNQESPRSATVTAVPSP